MRILVVEDEHKIANSIKRGLEQEGYAVDVAYDGELRRGGVEAVAVAVDATVATATTGQNHAGRQQS